ncbi:MAG: hypothetical protein GXY86_03680 [Firmicutes bacterium]|nr:hypothetical protein [Bacillota bacterium]
MDLSIIVIIAVVIVVFEILHEITNVFFKILLLAAKVLLISLEYVALYRIWLENGLFVKIAVPLSFVIFLILQIILFRKCEGKDRLRKALISSMIIGTPILSFITTYYLTHLFQIKIKIAFDMIDSILSTIHRKGN